MEAKGKPPGTNLADKLLNEPDEPERCCVVLRVLDEKGITNARARMIDTLRVRLRNAQSPEIQLEAQHRLGVALRYRGEYAEAERLLRSALEDSVRRFGAEHPTTLRNLGNLSSCLWAMGRLLEAEPLYHRALRHKNAPSVPNILTR